MSKTEQQRLHRQPPTALCWLCCLCCFLFPATARGQHLKIVGDAKGTALYFNSDKLWDYNLYEHSRWGGGLRLVAHPSRFIFNEVAADAYLGYGVKDEQWKYGVGLTEKIRGSRHDGTCYQRFVRDYFAAGSRRIANPWSGAGQLLGGFWALRMTDEMRATAGYRWQTASWKTAIEGEWRRRGMLFDNSRLLYFNQGAAIEYGNLAAARAVLRHKSGFSAQLEIGYIFNTHKRLARLLTQYDRTFRLSPFTLRLYCQAGLTPPETDYADLFDLGGTYGAPLLLGNNLVTAHPNEFIANAFGLVSMRMQTAKPIYSLYSSLFNIGSRPVPFIGLNVAWGTLWGEAADGSHTCSQIDIQSPNHAIAEPMAGVYGLVRWGVVDWGFAAVYRLVPPSAAYRRPNPTDNIALLLTASLIIQ